MDMKNKLFVLCAALGCGVNLMAATLCSGSSAAVKVNQASGARVAAASEAIRYSTAWETTASGATAVVAVNGTTLKSATGTGSVTWTPTRNGTYTLTHKVMNGSTQVGETLSSTFVVEGLVPENPVFSPVSGTTFDSSLTVSLSCASEGATIHYTTDGSEPTMESPVYKRFRISGKTTVKARAFYENGEGSEVVAAEYAFGRCADPKIASAGGENFAHSDNRVSITVKGKAAEDQVLRYTTDGSDPTEASPVYEGSFTISESMVVKAKVFSDLFFDSNIVTANLTRVWENVATPVITMPDSFAGAKVKVSIACATPGAVVRYTTNGNDPNSHSTKYTGPFAVSEGCTVKAYAVLSDYLNSEIASKTVVKVYGIGDTMGAPDHVFTTSGDAEFVKVTDATATLGESMKSGTIGNEQTSVLSTTVIGSGTLSFRWKTSCEADELHEWDHAAFAVDGETIACLDGKTDWTAVSQRIDGEGEHTVTWTYVKDDAESEGEDCVWVADYAWQSDFTETQTTDVPVPYAWLREKCVDVVDEYAVYERVAKARAENPTYTVEECYVAGLDPENPQAEFSADIRMDGMTPVVTPVPDLGETRLYKVWGKAQIDSDESWVTPVVDDHHFFKITVEMP